jgi:hypothetical protein
MSTCSERELISVYLDDELPPAYKADFEKHLEICQECAEEYKNQKALHELLTNDSKDTSFSEEELEESFKNLQIKMRFRESTAGTTRSENTFNAVFKKYIPAVAAATVFALILPLRIMGPKQTSQPIASIAQTATEVPLMKDRGVVSDSNMETATLASFFNTKNNSRPPRFPSEVGTRFRKTVSVPVSSATDSALAQKFRTIDLRNTEFLPEDYYRPDFSRPKVSQDGNNITITISLNPVFKGPGK